jgi:cyclopropane-fatty-acyl-phospholipid synthase
MHVGIAAAECGWLPDWAVRMGIRSLLRQRLRAQRREARLNPSARLDRRLAAMRRSPIALATKTANDQHYEVPPEFFRLVLGTRLKYSCCYWPSGVTDLDRAEEEMLAVTADRAQVADGMRVLDLGCGWGSLSLWIAEALPGTEVVAVSNSTAQRRHIESERDQRGLPNVTVVTADMNEFEAAGRFDRIISVEMFEHMRNYEKLLRRISQWLAVDGRLFVHIFAHRRFCYFFDDDGDGDWMARNFFTDGMMPSDDLLPRLRRDLMVERHWRISGQEYARTALAWLANLDVRRELVERVFATRHGTSGARREAERWRMFFLACAELFGFRGGDEWIVSHYRLRRVDEKAS